MDSVGYLRRFIDLELSLPEPDLNIYFKYLISKYDLKFENIEYFWLLLNKIAQSKNISLRDIDKLFINLNVLLPQIDIFNPEKQYKEIYTFIISNIYTYFILMKITNLHEYKKVIDKQYNQAEIENLLQILNIDNINVNFKNHDYKLLSSILRESISKFLELNLNLIDEESYKKIVNENHEKYKIGIDDAFRNENLFNLTNLWDINIQCSIINNLMFINNIKTN